MLPQSCWYPDHSEDADSVGGQPRGEEGCPFSGVTSSGRIWRKVPESDARSVDKTLNFLQEPLWPGLCRHRVSIVQPQIHQTCRSSRPCHQLSLSYSIYILKHFLEMYVNVVFVIRCLYSAVSLILVNEQCFIRRIIIIIRDKQTDRQTDREYLSLKSNTSLFHSKENGGATHELQTNKETMPTCMKEPQFKSAQ